MVKRIIHIGIAVENLEKAQTFFRDTMGLDVGPVESFGELRFSFILINGTSLELLQSTDPEGTIAKFIRKNGEGIHHVAFEVEDISSVLGQLKTKGVRLINEQPYLNAHKELVAFIHPKSTHGVLFELVQARDKGDSS
ncbi:MAG: methylmalonyl-CoA epimerase [Deltaproteobacteria bacterium]|nr:methylmalonyl-CoA epimerase [Deltaproteobacteria bacterium]